jgi:nitric oxide dioxygenase
MSITEEQKDIVRATAPILKENGKEITSIFYKNMFEAHPELLDIFNQTNQKIGTQPLALANTIYFAAENIDHLDALSSQVMLIAHKHRALSILPEHYPIVGKYLLGAIKEFLGEKSTQEILDAWGAAYGIIAQIFIDVEKKLYDELGSDEKDKGYIPFTIIKKEIVGSGPIVSLTLERRDGGKMFNYHPGQYITVRIKKDGHFHNRHYSLIEPFDGKTYRVAFKVEINEPKGVVSNEIIDNYKEGDEILASFPAGTFELVDNAKHSLFIAGGIGITVLSSMIQELNKQGKANSVTLIYCVPTKEHAAFDKQLKSILSQENQYQLLAQGERLEKDLLQKNLKSDTHVYICGSVPFMNKIEDCLAECGHPSSQIHIEAFQPTLSIIKGVKDQSTTNIL